MYINVQLHRLSDMLCTTYLVICCYEWCSGWLVEIEQSRTTHVKIIWEHIFAHYMIITGNMCHVHIQINVDRLARGITDLAMAPLLLAPLVVSWHQLRQPGHPCLGPVPWSPTKFSRIFMSWYMVFCWSNLYQIPTLLAQFTCTEPRILPTERLGFRLGKCDALSEPACTFRNIEVLEHERAWYLDSLKLTWPLHTCAWKIAFLFSLYRAWLSFYHGVFERAMVARRMPF